MPLASGARLGDGEVGAIIQGVLPRIYSVDVALRTRYVLLRDNESEPSQYAHIFLVNRGRREMLEVDTTERSSTATLQGLLGPPIVHASELKLSFNSKPPQYEQVDQEWMRNAELAFIERVPAGFFRTRLDVRGFRLSERSFGQRDISQGAIE